MNDEPVISITNLSKKFRLFSSKKDRLAEALHPFGKKYHEEFWALRDVNFTVNRGEIVGILGRNGSGKSTLLQVVCGVMQQTSGSVNVNGRISALLELGAGFNPEFTGRENVMLHGAIHGLSRQELLDRMNAIELFADVGVFFDQPVKLYSSGMFVRVAFAAAIHVDPEILIVDEALSVGDSKFQHRCYKRIRDFMEAGKTILVVSHSTDTLLNICNRGIVMDKGRVVLIDKIKDAVNHYQEICFDNSRANDVKGELVQSSKSPEFSDSLNKPFVSSLSSDSSDRIPLRKDYNRHEKRFGSGKARIVDFDLLVDGKLNPIYINPNSKCELIIKIHSNESVSLSVGFGIVTIDGRYVSGTNLLMLEQPLVSMASGECVGVKFSWEACLAGGDYFLNLGCEELADNGLEYVDVRRSVAKLTFKATSKMIGLVDLKVSSELVELPKITQFI